MRESRAKGAKTLGICNVVGSMIARESNGTIYTHAGPEIGVASTKAFTAQLTALFLFAVYLGQVRGTIDAEAIEEAAGGADAHSGQAGSAADARRGDGRSGEGISPRARLPIPGPRHALSHRAGRRVEAEGNLLHSRRGLSGGRDEARAECADRRRPAGGDSGDARC